MNVFIDVGAHDGASSKVALSFNFDVVIAFEPAPQHWDALAELQFDNWPRFHYEPFGLWSSETPMKLYDPGSIGASVFPDKPMRHPDPRADFFSYVHMLDASRWVSENLDDTNTNVMKLNCEGAECDILERLRHQLGYFQAVGVDFDAAKIPSQAHRVAEVQAWLPRLRVDKLPPCTRKMRDPAERIRAWLKSLRIVKELA